MALHSIAILWDHYTMLSVAEWKVLGIQDYFEEVQIILVEI